MRRRNEDGAVVLTIGGPLWEWITENTLSWMTPRSATDGTARDAVMRLIQNTEEERRATGRSEALLKLPTDPRRLFWLSAIVGRGSPGISKRCSLKSASEACCRRNADIRRLGGRAQPPMRGVAEAKRRALTGPTR
jgi:hypothetical protein